MFLISFNKRYYCETEISVWYFFSDISFAKSPVHMLYKHKLLLIAYKTFYSIQTHSHHNYLPRASQHNLELPSSTAGAGHRRVSYQCASLENGLPVEIELLGWRRASGMPWSSTYLVCCKKLFCFYLFTDRQSLAPRLALARLRRWPQHLSSVLPNSYNSLLK